MNMYTCMKINYISGPFIKLKAMASFCITTSSAMQGCHAEQLEFLVHGLRFARFYFRTIFLPNLSNRNQSLQEPWRHARVQAIRCTHHIGKRFPLHDNGVPPFTRERSGSVVECLTRDRRAAGSSLTGVTALWSLSKTHLS